VGNSVSSSVGSLTANILTSSGNPVTANQGGGLPPVAQENTFAVETDRTQAAQWETFTVVWGNAPGTFGLKTSVGNFLTAVNGGNVAADGDPIATNRTATSSWEEFTLNFNPPLTVGNPVDPNSGVIHPYTLPPPNTLQQSGPQTVTIQTTTSNFLTAVNNGGMNVDSTGQAISTDRQQMLAWETFLLASWAPADVYAHIQISIETGGDDLRGDSSAFLWCFASNQLNPAPGTTPTPFFSETLKADGDPGCGNNTSQLFNFQLPQPLPPWVFGNLTISMTSDPLTEYPILTSDNWDIGRLEVSLFNINPTTNQISNSYSLLSEPGTQTLADGSMGVARLTGSIPSVIFPILPRH